MTVLGDKLQEALNANNVNNYVWKGPKGPNGVQEEVKLMDCSYEQLSKFYQHCMQMLYNTDSKNPGRRTLMDIVQNQIQKYYHIFLFLIEAHQELREYFLYF